MLTEKEIDEALSMQVIGAFGTIEITENIRAKIIDNFRELGLVKENG